MKAYQRGRRSDRETQIRCDGRYSCHSNLPYTAAQSYDTPWDIPCKERRMRIDIEQEKEKGGKKEEQKRKEAEEDEEEGKG